VFWERGGVLGAWGVFWGAWWCSGEHGGLQHLILQLVSLGGPCTDDRHGDRVPPDVHEPSLKVNL